ncbi:MAG: 23S ribosomal RNA methyltransferase Erm [candidate division WOR-3 bacterium]|nr:MAG: 23S ribosomal RNA methyltransferase Erm [candidate division WOR-3 bacterium]
MNSRNRKSLAQNFLVKRHLAAMIVRESSISPEDVVYEIGPGKGILTEELITKARRVVSIEKDRLLYKKLKEKFEGTDNILLHNADFLKFKIKDNRFKVFANIPFNITSAVIRKLAFTTNPPDESYLIVQKEAAEKFTGMPKTTQLSVLLKPRFRMKITRSFRKTDFWPVPRVDVVMLHIEKRNPPLVSTSDMPIYEKFIKYGFDAWRRDLKANYKHVFTHRQWKKLSRDLEFPIHACPSELRFSQWFGLFEFYRRNVQG